jgi:predicted Zn-dependent peptidase
VTVLICLLLVSSGLSQSVNFKEFRLKNGLRVILAEDHSAPTYSIAVTYNVGSRDERPGRSGFAHLFEHMMFQGSENVGKGEHFLTVFNNGGNMNGTTSQDRTNYFETLPANQIELGLFLESDRMRSLAINQANLDNQRATVQEERRQRVDNQPYGKVQEAILATVYDNYPYKHSTIGSMDDLNAATLKDVEEFFRIYYAPNNAVLTMVGDFDTNEVLAGIRRYFEDIPSQPAPPLPDMTEPRQTSERRARIEDPLAQFPRLDIVYKIPPGNTPDWYALSVAARVLANGQSSRLYQKLVRGLEVATNVNANAQERRGPSMFNIGLVLRPGKDPGEVEKLIYQEIERIQNEPVTDIEMEKIRMSFRRSDIEQLSGTLGQAVRLGQFAVFYNDPGLINSYGQKFRSVSKDQIQQAARRYLTESNRSVILTLPVPRTAGGGQ